MKDTDKKNDLFTSAMSNLMKDKLDVSIDLLNRTYRCRFRRQTGLLG